MGRAWHMGLLLACSGCWLTHGHEPAPAADGDADADADGDADADAPAGDALRPELVCGMKGVTQEGGGTMRVLEWGCVLDGACDVSVANGTIDLRPRGVQADCETDAPFWIECAVPSGTFSAVSVWGEPVPTWCFGGDGGGACEFSPDCTELPEAPVPEGCTVRPITAYDVCGPEITHAGNRATVTLTDQCGCDGGGSAGCFLEDLGGTHVVRPLRYSCPGECLDAVCTPVEGTCTLYDLAPGTALVSAGTAACREPPVVSIEAVENAPGQSEPACAACLTAR